MPFMDTDSVSSDADILSHVSRGDREAFAELYDRFGDRVYGVCLKVLANRDLAAEVAQDVWLQIWHNSSRFDATLGTASGWVLRQAHSKAVDAVRSAEASRRRLHVVGQREAVVRPETPADIYAVAEEAQSVRTCLDSLTELQRQAVNLAYYRGMTGREIAAQTGSGLSAIKTRIRDGMLALRRCLASYE